MKKLSPFITAAIAAWFIYMSVGTGMYTYELAKFYGEDYKFSVHGIALNGRTGWGNQINVTDIATTTPVTGEGTVEEWCPNVTSKRGHVSMGFIGEEGESVCCWVSDSYQWLVPYKDVDNQRHYLCGEWPNLDYVIQPIKQSKLAILDQNSKQ